MTVVHGGRELVIRYNVKEGHLRLISGQSDGNNFMILIAAGRQAWGKQRCSSIVQMGKLPVHRSIVVNTV